VIGPDGQHRARRVEQYLLGGVADDALLHVRAVGDADDDERDVDLLHRGEDLVGAAQPVRPLVPPPGHPCPVELLLDLPHGVVVELGGGVVPVPRRVHDQDVAARRAGLGDAVAQGGTTRLGRRVGKADGHGSSVGRWGDGLGTR